MLFTEQFRVINGSAAAPGQFPHQVAIFVQTGLQRAEFCGGSIISNRWVLTAGHCIHFVAPRLIHNIILKMGSIYYSGGVSYSVDRVILHQRFLMSDTIIRNDLAMMRIEGSISFDENIQPIRIYQKFVEFGNVVTLSGWGRLNTRSNQIAETLQFATYETLSRNNCYAIIAKRLDWEEGLWGMLDDYICAWSNFSSACHGDSGGPLMMDNNLVGIASFGLNCTVPNAFVRMSKYQNWIQNVINFNHGKYLSPILLQMVAGILFIYAGGLLIVNTN